MPFTIVLGILLICCVGSRLQHPPTNLTMCMLACASLIAPICNIYSILVLMASLAQNYPVLILIVALVINYISNILHSIFSFATYRKD